MESYSVEAVLKAVDSGFSDTFKEASNTANSLSQRVGGSLQKVGKMSTITGLAVGAAAGKAIKSYGDFQESINKAAVIAGSSNKKLGSNMKDLEQVALSLGKTLPISAEDAGNAMVEMARNGASVGDLKKEFPAIAKAAALTGDDLSATATTVQNAMNIWGGGAKNAAKDSAILALNANKSKVGVADMGQVFANVGSTAKTLGFSVADVATATGIMANSGLDAAQGSMDLSHALTQMVKPSKNAKATMDKLGISYVDAKGNFKGMPAILKNVAQATDGMSKAQKIATLNTLFGAAGAKAMLPLLDSTQKKAKNGKSVWENYSGALNKVGGSAKSANKYLTENAQNMTKNVGQAIDQTVDAFDALIKTSIGDIAPQIMKVTDAIQDFVGKLTTSKSPMAKFVRGLIALSPVIAGVLVVFGLLSIGLGKLISAFSAPAKALGMFGKGAQKAGKFAGASAGQIAAMGVKAAGIGVGIGAAAAGIGVFAMGVAKMASTGKSGLIALAALTASIVVLAGTFALLKGPLTAAIPAMLALSATMLAAGVAAVLVGAGLTLLASTLPIVSQYGTSAAVGFAALAGAMILMAPALVLVAAGLLAMSVPLAAIAVVIVVVAATFTLMSVASIALGAGLVLVGAGLMIISASLPIVAQYGLQAALAMTALGAASVVMGAAAIVLAAGLLAVSIPLALIAVTLVVASAAALAFGAAIMLVGTGTLLAGAGMAMLAATLPMVAAGTLMATAALMAFSAAVLMITATSLAGAVGLAALGAAGIVAGVGLTAVGAAGMIAGVALTLIAAMIVVAAAGVVAFAAGVTRAAKPTGTFATNLLKLSAAGVAMVAGAAGIAAAAAAIGVFGAAVALVGGKIKSLSSAIVRMDNNFATMKAHIGSARSAVTSFASAASSAKGTVSGFATSVTSRMRSMGTSVKSSMNTAKSAVRSGFNGMKSAARSGAAGMVSAVKSKMASLKSAVSSAMRSAANSARSARGAFQSAGGYAAAGMRAGILAQRGSVMAAAASVASAAAAAARKNLKIHSPSRVFFGIGGYVTEGFINGIGSMNRSVVSAANGIGNIAANAISDPVNSLNANIGGSYSGSLTMQDSSLQMQNNALLRTIANKNTDLYLDGDTLVGGTADRMDNRLGNNTRLGARFS